MSGATQTVLFKTFCSHKLHVNLTFSITGHCAIDIAKLHNSHVQNKHSLLKTQNAKPQLYIPQTALLNENFTNAYTVVYFN